MHPPSIQHRGTEYDLKHLAHAPGRFDWVSKTRGSMSFAVRVRYGDHCYSRSIGEYEMLEDETIVSKSPMRVFCPERYSYSLGLPNLILGLFSKPGTTISLTASNRNWHMYNLYTSVGVTKRYCVFFHMRRRDGELLNVGGHASAHLDLYVESAYVKDEVVDIIKKAPFGRAAELTWCGERYF